MIFEDELIKWYQSNKRDLPWRNTTDPYIIWLSEIILQQTRVEQGLPYFYRFLERYPDVRSFAATSEDEILSLWQGLGYYSRGRNMLKTARQVVDEYNGVFPVKYHELIKLKGIGEYTAAAISSFAANEPRAVLDGNVFRVLARYFGISDPINSPGGRKVFQQTAAEMLNNEQPAIYNQAIMEFGALLCKPKNPACGICPVRLGCYAFKHNATTQLPVKLKTVNVRDRFLTYFLLTDGKKVLMTKRDESDIWANMYDMPLIETTSLIPPGEVIRSPSAKELFGDNISIIQSFPVQKHLLTHQRLFVQFVYINKLKVKLERQFVFTEVENLKNLALPKIIFIFINNFFKL